MQKKLIVHANKIRLVINVIVSDHEYTALHLVAEP